jgi:hypothetical protein
LTARDTLQPQKVDMGKLGGGVKVVRRGEDVRKAISRAGLWQV